MRFNPPPNWPRFPNGWTPPAGWQPDPSWPPPPVGWPLWLPDAQAQARQDTFVLAPPAPIPGYSYVPVHATRVPWHRRTLAVVLLLIFFFPVGLVLLWLRQDWSVRRRGLITAVVAVFAVIALASPNQQPDTVAIQAGPAAGIGASTSSAPQPTTSTTPPPVVPTTQPSQSASTAVATSSSPAATKTSAAAVVAAPKTTVAPVHTTAAPTTHSATPAPPKTTSAAPKTPSLCGAPSNPWGYNFCGTGSYITSPNSNVCNYFHCIDNFSNGVGYMIECRDGMYSMSGGRRGACSDHGGEEQAVFSG